MQHGSVVPVLVPALFASSCRNVELATQEPRHVPPRAGFVPLTDLRLTSRRLGSHSVDFASLRSPQHHLVSSAKPRGVFSGVRFHFAGWAYRCVAVHSNLLVQSKYLLVFILDSVCTLSFLSSIFIIHSGHWPLCLFIFSASGV